MNEQKGTAANIESLMEKLASKDGVVRQKAREELVLLGKPAVSYLIQALQNTKRDQVRWEAAKALGSINDTRSIPPLVKALEDSNSDVAWTAADALKTFRKDAWPPLLQALIKSKSESVALRKGAHHVLVEQKEDGFNDLLATLLRALESSSAPESSAVAANEILKRMNVT
jgi:HEAT repeat protein